MHRPVQRYFTASSKASVRLVRLPRQPQLHPCVRLESIRRPVVVFARVVLLDGIQLQMRQAVRHVPLDITKQVWAHQAAQAVLLENFHRQLV